MICRYGFDQHKILIQINLNLCSMTSSNIGFAHAQSIHFSVIFVLFDNLVLYNVKYFEKSIIGDSIHIFPTRGNGDLINPISMMIKGLDQLSVISVNQQQFAFIGS